MEMILNEFSENIKYIHTIDKKEGEYLNYPENINGELKEFLLNECIFKLYKHQYLAYKKLEEKKNILVTTPTASGKSLCYNLYILDFILKNKDLSPKAFYIFPTKALTLDQIERLSKINIFLEKISNKFNINIYKYDGDTPSSIRSAIRVKGDIILTNPDMLHSGILPNHTKWAKLFQNLRFIVIDELHIYKGIFGSHFALVIERLKRIAKFYGNNNIQFILLSATISNALEHAKSIINEDVFLINDNGAPTLPKKYIFYNPPFIKNLNIRRGILPETVKLVRKLLKETDYQIINFFPSRILVELAYTYLIKTDENLKDIISTYRGGYLPNERKEIQKKLKEKKIRYIATTNALELGIDIGSFDVCIISSFPDSISSFFQQAGRAGRKGEAYIFFIASNSPIDQYFIDNPETFFSLNPESPLINPLNKYVYYSHLKCSTFEIPFNYKEKFYNVDPINFLDEMNKENIVKKEGENYYYSDVVFPAENISLRNSEPENFIIVNITNNKNEIIGEMDRISAYSLLFPKAIYIHRGELFEVVQLDIQNAKAYIKETNANYYTDALTKTDIEVLKEIKQKYVNLNKNNVILSYTNVIVTTTVFKYKKIKFFTSENVGYGDVSLPSYQFPTEALFVGFENIQNIFNNVKLKLEKLGKLKRLEKLEEFSKEAIKENIESNYLDIFLNFYNIDSYCNELTVELINSLAYQTINILSFYLSCDKKDLGYADFLKSPFYKIPGFFVFDKIVGGVNLSKEAFNLFPFIFNKFIQRMNNCSCLEGCPSCIGIVDNLNGYKKLNKKIMKYFLEELI